MDPQLDPYCIHLEDILLENINAASTLNCDEQGSSETLNVDDWLENINFDIPEVNANNDASTSINNDPLPENEPCGSGETLEELNLSVNSTLAIIEQDESEDSDESPAKNSKNEPYGISNAQLKDIRCQARLLNSKLDAIKSKHLKLGVLNKEISVLKVYHRAYTKIKCCDRVIALLAEARVTITRLESQLKQRTQELEVQRRLTEVAMESKQKAEEITKESEVRAVKAEIELAALEQLNHQLEALVTENKLKITTRKEMQAEENAQNSLSAARTKIATLREELRSVKRKENSLRNAVIQMGDTLHLNQLLTPHQKRVLASINMAKSGNEEDQQLAEREMLSPDALLVTSTLSRNSTSSVNSVSKSSPAVTAASPSPTTSPALTAAGPTAGPASTSPALTAADPTAGPASTSPASAASPATTSPAAASPAAASPAAASPATARLVLAASTAASPSAAGASPTAAASVESIALSTSLKSSGQQDNGGAKKIFKGGTIVTVIHSSGSSATPECKRGLNTDDENKSCLTYNVSKPPVKTQHSKQNTAPIFFMTSSESEEDEEIEEIRATAMGENLSPRLPQDLPNVALPVIDVSDAGGNLDIKDQTGRETCASNNTCMPSLNEIFMEMCSTVPRSVSPIPRTPSPQMLDEEDDWSGFGQESNQELSKQKHPANKSKNLKKIHQSIFGEDSDDSDELPEQEIRGDEERSLTCGTNTKVTLTNAALDILDAELSVSDTDTDQCSVSPEKPQQNVLSNGKQAAEQPSTRPSEHQKSGYLAVSGGSSVQLIGSKISQDAQVSLPSLSGPSSAGIKQSIFGEDSTDSDILELVYKNSVESDTCSLNTKAKDTLSDADRCTLEADLNLSDTDTDRCSVSPEKPQHSVLSNGKQAAEQPSTRSSEHIKSGYLVVSGGSKVSSVQLIGSKISQDAQVSLPSLSRTPSSADLFGEDSSDCDVVLVESATCTKVRLSDADRCTLEADLNLSDTVTDQCSVSPEKPQQNVLSNGKQAADKPSTRPSEHQKSGFLAVFGGSSVQLIGSKISQDAQVSLPSLSGPSSAGIKQSIFGEDSTDSDILELVYKNSVESDTCSLNTKAKDTLSDADRCTLEADLNLSDTVTDQCSVSPEKPQHSVLSNGKQAAEQPSTRPSEHQKSGYLAVSGGSSVQLIGSKISQDAQVSLPSLSRRSSCADLFGEDSSDSDVVLVESAKFGLSDADLRIMKDFVPSTNTAKDQSSVSLLPKSYQHNGLSKDDQGSEQPSSRPSVTNPPKSLPSPNELNESIVTINLKRKFKFSTNKYQTKKNKTAAAEVQKTQDTTSTSGLVPQVIKHALKLSVASVSETDRNADKLPEIVIISDEATVAQSSNVGCSKPCETATAALCPDVSRNGTNTLDKTLIVSQELEDNNELSIIAVIPKAASNSTPQPWTYDEDALATTSRNSTPQPPTFDQDALAKAKSKGTSKLLFSQRTLGPIIKQIDNAMQCQLARSSIHTFATSLCGLYSVEMMARAIILNSVESVDHKKNCVTPSTELTESQRRFLNFLLLTKNLQEFKNVIDRLSSITSMLILSPPKQMNQMKTKCALAVFLVELSKKLNDLLTPRALLYDACTLKMQCAPIVSTMLIVWPDLLPKISPSGPYMKLEDLPTLPLCIVSCLLTVKQTQDRTGKKCVAQLVEVLEHNFGYQTDLSVTATARIVVGRLEGNIHQGAEPGLLLLSKWETPKWVINQLIDGLLLPFLTAADHSMLAAQTAVKLIGELIRENKVTEAFVQEMITFSVDLLQSTGFHDMQEACAQSLLFMSSNPIFVPKVQNALSNWHPTLQVSQRYVQHLMNWARADVSQLPPLPLMPPPETPAPPPETPDMPPKTPAPTPETPDMPPKTPAPTPATPDMSPKTPAPTPETPAPTPGTSDIPPETPDIPRETPAMPPAAPTTPPETQA